MQASQQLRERHPPHVVLVIPQFYPVVGGAESMVRYTAAALLSSGWEVTVVTQTPLGMQSGTATIDGIQVVRLPNYSRLPGPARALAFWAATASWTYRRRDDLTVIHAHQLYAATGPCLTRWAHGLPVVVHLHGGRAHGVGISELAHLHTRHLGRWRARSIMSAAGLVLTSSPALVAEVHDGYPGTPAHWCPNGIDGSRFIPPTPGQRLAAKRTLGLDNRPCAIYVGRLTPTKGADRLLRLWLDRRELPQPWPQLIVCGDGDLRPDFSQGSTQHPDIHYVGAVDDVRPYLWAADFFLLPSRYEGMPLALLEAMACGLPAVAMDVGAVGEAIIDRQTGYLVYPQGNGFELDGDFAGAVQALTECGELRQALGVAARRRFESLFELKAIVTQLIEWYHSLIHAPTDGPCSTTRNPGVDR